MCIRDRPSTEADIQIVPGNEAGASDIVIAWKQSFPLRLTLAVNDGGFDSTGKYQGSITVAGDHLLALNDLFYASFNHDLGGGQAGKRGTRGSTLHYSLPWDYWMLGATTSACLLYTSRCVEETGPGSAAPAVGS